MALTRCKLFDNTKWFRDR